MPTATDVFRWTDAYRVNVSILDQQHQDLFDAVNQLEQALRAGEGSASINAVLERLVTYSSLHFATEESLMAKHGFPGLTIHQGEHEMFRKRIGSFLEDHAAHKVGVPVKLLLFLQAWLKQHLLNSDKRYSAFLNARGVR